MLTSSYKAARRERHRTVSDSARAEQRTRDPEAMPRRNAALPLT